MYKGPKLVILVQSTCMAMRRQAYVSPIQRNACGGRGPFSLLYITSPVKQSTRCQQGRISHMPGRLLIPLNPSQCKYMNNSARHSRYKKDLLFLHPCDVRKGKNWVSVLVPRHVLRRLNSFIAPLSSINILPFSS